MRLADIPQSVVVARKPVPYQGVAIQITWSDAFRSAKESFTVDEKERHYISTKV